VVNGHSPDGGSGYEDGRYRKSTRRTDSPDGGTDIATLVRHALAEVCTVSVLIVKNLLPSLTVKEF